MENIRRLLLIGIFVLASACRSSNDVYSLEHYQYFNDDEVHVYVHLPQGGTKEYRCSFPANTDYQHMQKVRIKSIRSNNLPSGIRYNCETVLR